MAAHLSALVAVAGMPFGHVIGPLVVYLIKGHESEFVAEHARASLNYQITASIAVLVVVIGAVAATLAFAASAAAAPDESRYPAAFAMMWFAIVIAILLVLLFSLIFIILGTIAASEGRPYTYPFAIRFLR